VAAVKNIGQCITSVIQQASVKEFEDEYFHCKLSFSLSMMNVKEKEVPAKFVPAAAVIRMGQVLFIRTRRKGLLGGYVCFL